jgi:para-aminobenzoate synthetase component 1
VFDHVPARLDLAPAGVSLPHGWWPAAGLVAMADPVDVISCDLTAPPDLSISNDRQDRDPFERLRHCLKSWIRPIRWTGPSPWDSTREEDDTPPTVPFGWFGYLAYEAGRWIEDLPATVTHDVGLPVARFGLYDTVAIFEQARSRWLVAAIDLTGTPWAERQAPIDQRLEGWSELIGTANRSKDAPRACGVTSSPEQPGRLAEASRLNLSRQDYETIVATGRDYIAAGDIFQVNLARRETHRMTETPVETYLRLRRTNPAGYAAFLQWQHDSGPQSILSSSPELFLRLSADGQVETRPIKGTRRRSEDPTVDAARRLELAVSEKDRAELAMIVDLERNDLGRVCEFGSIQVADNDTSPAGPYDLEEHPTVYHLVAPVRGRLREGCDAIDLLRACFPGGSITGAPKVRAMEIIDELEPNERSVYTGAIGYFSLDGSMTLNIAIRTLIGSQDHLHVYAGGGIVADSVPADEYEETVAKALGMRRALQCEPAGQQTICRNV